MMNGGPIDWVSRLFRCTAHSSTEAEYMALGDAVNEGLYLLRLQRETVRNDKTICIYEDNTGAIAISKNPKNFRQTRHIDYRYHHVRDKVASGQFDIQYVPSAVNLADIMTKALPTAVYRRLTKGIFGINTMAAGSEISDAIETGKPVRFYESYEELERRRQVSWPFA